MLLGSGLHGEKGKKDDSTRDVTLRSAGFASYRTPQGQRAASNDKSDDNSGWSHPIAATAATATTAVGETSETRETTG